MNLNSRTNSGTPCSLWC